MADPVSIGVMTAISIGASAAGGLMQAKGHSALGASEAAMYQYKAGIAEMNKQIALQNAEYERAAGGVQAQMVALRHRERQGITKTAQGASGLDVSSGSAKLVRDSQAAVAQHDQGMVRSNAARRAYAYEVEAVTEEHNANLAKMGAKHSLMKGKYGAIGSLIGTAAGVSGKIAGAGQSGAFGAFGGGGAGGTGSLIMGT